MNQSVLAIPVVDAHIHLFDPRRPQGVPWPPAGDLIHAPALPPRFAAQSEPFGVVAAIAVEASPWLDDNDWMAQVVAEHPLMLGFIGNLEPDAPSFAATLDRHATDPRFLGLRYGNLWDRPFAEQVTRPVFLDGLRRLAEHDRVLESANPDPALIASLLRLTDALPELRVVVDHLPQAQVPAASQAAYERDLDRLAARAQVAMKLTEIPRIEAAGALFDPAWYRARLDGLWDRFGPSRSMFGSDWPNSEHFGSYQQTFQLATAFLADKSPDDQARVMWRNAWHIYRLQPRTPAQAQLLG